jgi:hypothetical protein
MEKRKVTLYMKNGNSYSVVCQDDEIYENLLQEIDNDERISISYSGKVISIKGSQIDYHEWEYL